MSDLNRFLKAQENTYIYALEEIKDGKKRSHWMWFIFPQLVGLGYSYYANYYGISSLEEYNSIASMITSSSPVTPAIDIHTINDNNLFAQYILSRDLIFDFGYLKKITTNEIFLGTMDAQNNTTAKIIEEKCRYDYQYGRYMQMLNDKFID